jgi:hypothetical protein
MSENLIDAFEQIDQGERVKALETYRQLLGRASCPQDGDAKELRQCMLSLGKTVADVRADLAALATAAKLEKAIVGNLPDLEADLAAAGESQRAFIAAEKTKKRELEIEGNTVVARYSRAQRAVRDHREATGALGTHKSKHAALFGLASVPPLSAPEAPRTGFSGIDGVTQGKGLCIQQLDSRGEPILADTGPRGVTIQEVVDVPAVAVATVATATATIDDQAT